MKKSWQGQIQDLNLGGTNVASFTRVTNVVTDLRHALIQDMALEANILEVCIFMPLSMWFINYC